MTKVNYSKLQNYIKNDLTPSSLPYLKHKQL